MSDGDGGGGFGGDDGDWLGDGGGRSRFTGGGGGGAGDGHGGGRATGGRDRGSGCGLALLLLVALALFAAFAENDERGPGGSASPSPPPADSGAGWDEPAEDHDAQPQPEPHPVEDASAGDCFANAGTPDDADLEPVTCGDGVFEVREVIPAHADCLDYTDAETVDWTVAYPSLDVRLCLAYRHSGGSAYHAGAGGCVYGGQTDDAPWEETPCQTGNFTVVDRFDGESSWDDCDRSAPGHHGRSFSVSGWDTLDVRLCLRMNYPDDAGLAAVDNCLLMTGPENAPTFSFTGCGQANVYVTGRADGGPGGDFCGDYGATTWRHEHFPELGYTVCWQWL
ncbi:LppU/SCO3897 family protein [Streptomyces sedi]|uniref:Uncharacterized protein n=1 Tax=Streptomyces sedi TaxID=555059 RepID=A0A5C4V554_9ACTN|nr:hypothetical protein [Streptomyces sedi]TNM30987.1 hypothetical protein FH715_09805 [Streptomyces sedi]